MFDSGNWLGMSFLSSGMLVSLFVLVRVLGTGCVVYHTCLCAYFERVVVDLLKQIIEY